jgi:hypothetical protein
MIVLLYLGAGLTILWGISHLIPTRNVVNDFGDISMDNRHIITMEWIVEGVSLIFIGGLVIVVTAIAPYALVSKAVFIVASLELFVLALISLFTGFKVDFFPFKLCPLILSISAVLILLGTFA